jgi:F-type H+-transporting ATPase subunit delta
MSDQEQQIIVHHATVLDDEARHVGKVYAEALFRAAEGANQTGEVLEELAALLGIFRKDPGLELFLSSAAIGQHRKEEAIRKAFTGRASEVLTNFLLVLNNHGRLDSLRAITEAYRTLSDRKTGHVIIRVRSAVPLTDEERSRLCDDVRAVRKLQPVLQETVDPSLLGGMIVYVGDWVYDASVRTRLLEIRNHLIEESSHAIQSGRDRFGA